MKKILLLLANGFEMYEAGAFIDVIGWNKTYGTKDTELVTCGLFKNIKSTFDIKINVDFTIDEIKPNEFVALGISGVLQGKNATTYNLMSVKRQKRLKAFGARIINEPIVEDANIITSWSPVTAIDVAFRLLEHLTDKNIQIIFER